MTSSSDWVVLAKIVRPQGRHGELLAEILTDFPESFSQRRRLFLRPGSEAGGASPREAKLENHWFHKDRVVLKLAGVDSINDAETLRGFEVVLPIAERMPLTGDAVYVSDLVGMHVVDVVGGGEQEAGEVIDVLPEGAGPAMLVVRTGNPEPALIPFVRAYLKNVDLQARRIEMALPEGLIAVQGPLTREERLLHETQGDE